MHVVQFSECCFAIACTYSCVQSPFFQKHFVENLKIYYYKCSKVENIKYVNHK